MAYQVVPDGTLIISQLGSDEQIEIQSSAIIEGSTQSVSDPSFKGDEQQSVINFSANTDFGTFMWSVEISIGASGMNIDNPARVDLPPNVIIVQDVTFIEKEI